MESFLTDSRTSTSGRWSKHNSSTYPTVPYWFNESTGDSIWTDPAVATKVTDSRHAYRTLMEEKLNSNRVFRSSEMERINNSTSLSKAEKDIILKDCIMEVIKNDNCFIKNISSIVQQLHMNIVLEAITSILLLENFPLNSTLADRYIKVMKDSIDGIELTYDRSFQSSAEKIYHMLVHAVIVLCLKHLITNTVDEKASQQVYDAIEAKAYSEDEFLARLCMQSCDHDAKSIDRVYEMIRKIFGRRYTGGGSQSIRIRHRIHVLSFHPNLAFEFRMKLLKFNHITDYILSHVYGTGNHFINECI